MLIFYFAMLIKYFAILIFYFAMLIKYFVSIPFWKGKFGVCSYSFLLTFIRDYPAIFTDFLYIALNKAYSHKIFCLGKSHFGNDAHTLWWLAFERGSDSHKIFCEQNWHLRGKNDFTLSLETVAIPTFFDSHKIFCVGFRVRVPDKTGYFLRDEITAFVHSHKIFCL